MHISPSPNVVEAIDVSPAKLDTDSYQNMDDLEVPKLTLDELQGPKLHHGLGELPISKLSVDEHQELKQHRNLDITKISKVTLEEGQEARQHDNFEEHRIQKVPPNEDEYDHPFRDSPITAALKVLAGGNISIVEYGTQVQFRCGYEEVPVVSGIINLFIIFQGVALLTEVP